MIIFFAAWLLGCVCACGSDIPRVSTLSCTQLAVYNFTEYTSLDQYGGTTSAAWSCSEGCDELRLGNRICDLACNTSACVWDQVSSASKASQASSTAAASSGTLLKHTPSHTPLLPILYYMYRAIAVIMASTRSRRSARPAAPYRGRATAIVTRRASMPRVNGMITTVRPPRRGAGTTKSERGGRLPSCPLPS